MSKPALNRRRLSVRIRVVRIDNDMEVKMNGNVAVVINALRANVENVSDGWGEVYLDNARPAWMSDKTFRACLSSLSKSNAYRVIDGYAWGKVKMEVQS